MERTVNARENESINDVKTSNQQMQSFTTVGSYWGTRDVTSFSLWKECRETGEKEESRRTGDAVVS